MFSTFDTIVAIATPPGRGGIGVVRVSGPEARAIASRLIDTRPLAPRYATFTRICIRDKSSRAPSSNRCPGRAPSLDPAAIEDRFEDRPLPSPTRIAATLESAVERVTGAPVATSVDPTGDAIDHAVVTYFPGPHSYTGDDVVEMSAHGSPVILQTIVAAAVKAGARLAEPGEFTLRAFLNGRIDLTQAEAVADLIEAATPLQARAAFDQLQGTLTAAIAAIDAQLFDLVARLEASVDFPEEGFHFVDPESVGRAIDAVSSQVGDLLRDGRTGRLIREGLQIALVGKPNVGKSSLFNALVGASRAIVTEVPGTTRDLVTETIDLNGLRATLIDTAGLRDPIDVIEQEGMRRTRAAATVADLTLLVLDRSNPDEGDYDPADLLMTGSKWFAVANKSDLRQAWTRADAINVSAVSGEGLEELRRRIFEALDVELRPDRPAITNIRHIALLERAQTALSAARAAAREKGTLPEEFILADLQEARAALEEITGRRTAEDLLAHIFSRFCIGK